MKTVENKLIPFPGDCYKFLQKVMCYLPSMVGMTRYFLPTYMQNTLLIVQDDVCFCKNTAIC